MGTGWLRLVLEGVDRWLIMKYAAVILKCFSLESTAFPQVSTEFVSSLKIRKICDENDRKGKPLF